MLINFENKIGNWIGSNVFDLIMSIKDWLDKHCVEHLKEYGLSMQNFILN